MSPRAAFPQLAKTRAAAATEPDQGRVGACLVAKLRQLDARLEEVAPRVLAHESDDEAVHDLRVALRRTRTVLELGRDVLGSFHANEVRRALRDLQRATGALRDEEVLRALLESLGVHRPDVAAWLEGRRLRERRLRRALVRLLRSGALDEGHRLLTALLAFRIQPSRDKRLSKYARRAAERARREVDRRRGARSDDPEALHRLRIAYKRLRYSVETFADALPEDLAALAQSAARMQARLGDLHDVDVAIASVRRARALSQESRAELLAALERTRINRVLAYGRLGGEARDGRGSPSLSPLLQRSGQAVGVVSLRKISTR